MDSNSPSKSITTKPAWFADVADISVLFFSFLLTSASIVLVVLVFNTQANYVPSGFVPTDTLSILQQAISALSVTIVSAMIMMAGKHYVFLRGGIHNQRATSPSISNLARHLARHGFELPILALSAVWMLGWATALTVNDVWTMAPTVYSTTLLFPTGPFEAPVSQNSLLLQAYGQLSYVMGSVCAGLADTAGLIKIGGDLQLTSGGPMGTIYYPPLPNSIPNSEFSLSTSLNGFNISMESLSSVPVTAQNLTCAGAGLGFETGRLWYEGGDNQTLSIIASSTPQSQLYRFNASAIMLDGTLQSTLNTTEFVPDGTTSPIVMPDDQWALDIASLVCNATQPVLGSCLFSGSSLIDFSIQLNSAYDSFSSDAPTATGVYWSTALVMAMGAYSSAWSPLMTSLQIATVTSYSDLMFTPRYGVYVLMANILVSAIMLVLVIRLRMASRLRADLIRATRLSLNLSRTPKSFNVTLDDALGDPYMSVSGNKGFPLTEKSLSEKGESLA